MESTVSTGTPCSTLCLRTAGTCGDAVLVTRAGVDPVVVDELDLLRGSSDAWSVGLVVDPPPEPQRTKLLRAKAPRLTGHLVPSSSVTAAAHAPTRRPPGGRGGPLFDAVDTLEYPGRSSRACADPLLARAPARRARRRVHSPASDRWPTCSLRRGLVPARPRRGRRSRARRALAAGPELPPTSSPPRTSSTTSLRRAGRARLVWSRRCAEGGGRARRACASRSTGRARRCQREHGRLYGRPSSRWRRADRLRRRPRAADDGVIVEPSLPRVRAGPAAYGGARAERTAKLRPPGTATSTAAYGIPARAHRSAVCEPEAWGRRRPARVDGCEGMSTSCASAARRCATRTVLRGRAAWPRRWASGSTWGREQSLLGAPDRRLDPRPSTKRRANGADRHRIG